MYIFSLIACFSLEEVCLCFLLNKGGSSTATTVSVGQVSPSGKHVVASTILASVDVEVVSESDEVDSQPLSSFKRLRDEVHSSNAPWKRLCMKFLLRGAKKPLASLAPSSLARRTPVVHVSISKVGKLSSSLSKVGSTLVDVSISSVDHSHSPPPVIVLMGSKLDLGVSTYLALTSTHSSYVASFLSFPKDRPLLSYLTDGANVVS
ncbi:hypothetical protein L1987_30316 [Smallanthus sonchifolius]|uniref:Uncharacterized protein n=1 Tax=Smallanthus sonchifolius TaxID=185202 RepID=A0ACB9I3S5_9ASTR|nr:hypothetical protein L1987_30316 [Smallanthus sonchifolius]